MNVFVLGHRGMLGSTVAKYLDDHGHRVATSEERYVPSEHRLTDEIKAAKPDVIVNAIGIIPQKSNSDVDMYRINAAFPHILCSRFPDTRIIHASTDCVFSGKTHEAYNIYSRPDAEDAYGLSKAMGETICYRPNVTVLRGSIIGLEAQSTKGLMSWCLSTINPIQGYANVYWNGVTTLQWAVIAERAISKTSTFRSLEHVGFLGFVSKYILIKSIRKFFKPTFDVPVIPTDLGERPTFKVLDPTIISAHIDTQLAQYAKWVSKF